MQVNLTLKGEISVQYMELLFFFPVFYSYDAAFHKYGTTKIYPAEEFYFPPFSYFKVNVYI